MRNHYVSLSRVKWDETKNITFSIEMKIFTLFFFWSLSAEIRTQSVVMFVNIASMGLGNNVPLYRMRHHTAARVYLQACNVESK